MVMVEIPDRVYDLLREHAAEDETIGEVLTRFLDDTEAISEGKGIREWKPFKAEWEKRSLEEIQTKYQ